MDEEREGSERLDILHHGEWEKGGGGGVVLSPEARKQLGTQLNDPLEFVVKTLLPALNKAHVTGRQSEFKAKYIQFLASDVADESSPIYPEQRSDRKRNRSDEGR